MINPVQMRYGIGAAVQAKKGLAQKAFDMAQELGVDFKIAQDRLFKAKMSGLDLTNPDMMKKAITGDFQSMILPSKHNKKDMRPSARDSYAYLTRGSRINNTTAGDRFDSGDVLRRGGASDVELNSPDDLKLVRDAVVNSLQTGKDYFSSLGELL